MKKLLFSSICLILGIMVLAFRKSIIQVFSWDSMFLDLFNLKKFYRKTTEISWLIFGMIALFIGLALLLSFILNQTLNDGG